MFLSVWNTYFLEILTKFNFRLKHLYTHPTHIFSEMSCVGRRIQINIHQNVTEMLNDFFLNNICAGHLILKFKQVR